jgi:hypothetical protein
MIEPYRAQEKYHTQAARDLCYRDRGNKFEGDNGMCLLTWETWDEFTLTNKENNEVVAVQAQFPQCVPQ